MSQNEKRLGQGLNALFDSKIPDGEPSDNPFMWLTPQQLIPNPNQPRRNFEDASLHELADSIRVKGVLQPLLVRPAEEEGKWQIIAGERRWRASQIAEIDKIPVIVQKLDDNDTMIAAMMENIHREELNPIERALGLDAIKSALCVNQAELAAFLGMQRSTVTNLLRLLGLPQLIKDDLIAGRLTAGHARCLITLPEEPMLELRQRIIDMGMNARGTELAAAYWQKEQRFPWTKNQNGEKDGRKNPDIIKLSKQISQTLHCRASVNGSSEKGRISLSYDSNEQLYDLLDKLGLSMSNE